MKKIKNFRCYFGIRIFHLPTALFKEKYPNVCISHLNCLASTKFVGYAPSNFCVDYLFSKLTQQEKKKHRHTHSRSAQHAIFCRNSLFK